MVEALRSLERLLLPNSCVACGRLAGRASPDALVCALCSSRLRVVPVGCKRCAQPLPPVGPCRFCADWPETLSHVRSAVWLGDEAREIVHYLKYEGYTKLARLAAQSIARVIPRPHSAVLVPVPLSRRRLRHRCYNQAEVIARELGRTWDVPCDSGLLIRTRDTKTQTALTPDERNSNVAGAFFASPALSPRAEASSIILIDDAHYRCNASGGSGGPARGRLVGCGRGDVCASITVRGPCGSRRAVLDLSTRILSTRSR
jgi:predicted amidophosphoribosyltransferase